MDVLSWALYALAAAAALAVAAYIYLLRETPGRGRPLLALLRFAALALLILLIFDPELPTTGLAAGGSRTRVLVDGSLSMRLPAVAGDSASRWARAAAEAERIAPGREVLVFGSTPRVLGADSLAGFEPEATASALGPALQAASESGARRVVVLSDGGLEDAAEVTRMLPRLGMDVEVRSIAESAPENRALAEVEVPAWAETGKPVDVRVGVTSLGAEGDSVTVVLRHEDQVLAQTRVATAAAGRVAVGTLRFTPESPGGEGGAAGERGGLVRYDLEIEQDDVEADDDRRSVYIFVSERPAGVALVSFRPDWEPRFLQPVLEQTLGVPVRGFAHAGGGRYVRIAAGLEAGMPAGEVEVRRAVQQADLLVLHGLDADAPAWAREAAARARRLLAFPGDDGAGLPVAVGGPAPGEWYVSADLPPSPLAGMLGTFRAEELPPLAGLRSANAAGAWAPLVASRSRRGPTSPAIIAGEQGGRRWAVALADGYWQWAFRGGEARQVYRRLWAALGGWLAHEDQTIAAAAIRPVQRTVPRGEAVRWVAPGLAADSIAFRITAEDSTAALDTVMPMLRGDTAATPALAPGHYRFEARAFSQGQEVAAATGPFTVESYSPEFTRPAVALAGLDAARPGGGAPRRPDGEPLHTSPWPYVLLLMIVSAEWALRRRWGLR